MHVTTESLAKFAKIPVELMPALLKILSEQGTGFLINEFIKYGECSITETPDLYDIEEALQQEYQKMFTVPESEAAELTGYARASLVRLRKGEIQRHLLASKKVYEHKTEPFSIEGIGWIIKDKKVFYTPAEVQRIAEKRNKKS